MDEWAGVVVNGGKSVEKSVEWRESSRRGWAYIRVLRRIEYWLQGAFDGRLNRTLVQHDVASPCRDVVSTTAITLPRFVELSLFTLVHGKLGILSTGRLRLWGLARQENYTCEVPVYL